MTIEEIKEWREDNLKFDRGIDTADIKFEIIDTLLAALGEKEERLAIKDDALCAATMVGEFAISKLKVATEALERIESGDFINSAFSPAKVIAAAALKEIGGWGMSETQDILALFAGYAIGKYDGGKK